MREMLLQRMLTQATPSETETVQALAGIIAAIEAEQSEAILELLEATNEGQSIDVDVIDPDDRAAELLGVADAISDDRLAEFYFAEISNLPNGEQAANYAGLGTGDDWDKQKREWYRSYHREGVVEVDPDDVSDDRIQEVAEKHIGEVFGVPMHVFESEVLEWSQAAALESILSGPIQSHTAVIKSTADDLDRDDE